MSERFTERARKVMDLAGEEARRFNHEYIGTEHILLAMAAEGSGSGARVMRRLGVNLEQIYGEVEKLVKPGPQPVAKGKLPQTPRAKGALDYATEERKRLRHMAVGTEHLLIGLMSEQEGIAAQVLMNMGLDIEKVRQEVVSLADTGPDDDVAEETQVDSAEATRYVNQLLTEAIKSRASDVHLESTEDGVGRVRLRIDGRLNTVPGPGRELFQHVIRRVMYMANLDAADEKMPMDGRIMIKIADQSTDIRVSAVPTIFGQRVVMRILRRDGVILGLDKIGLLEDDLAKLRELCGTPAGIIICTGPTGSGKTTLLYSMLQEVNREEVCVMTVEDPVEFCFAGMGQIQIRPQIGLGFDRAIRHILRQDPDVIMVGEIRDLDTLNACVQSALTGHLILTTLHANTAPGAIKRVMDVGIEPFLVNGAVTAIIAQRLVRVLCPKCKQPAEPPKHSMPPEAIEFLWSLKDAEFFGPKGCEHCHQGYRGRTGINEILVMDDRIRQIVADTADVSAIRDAACQAGMKTMLQNGLEKAAAGITSIEEVIRTAPRGIT